MMDRFYGDTDDYYSILLFMTPRIIAGMVAELLTMCMYMIGRWCSPDRRLALLLLMVFLKMILWKFQKQNKT